MILPVWFRPWMAWAVMCAALAVAAGVQTVRLSGAQADHAETLKAVAEDHARQIEEARKKEKDLRTSIDEIQAKSQQEIDDAKIREDALLRSVRSGERKLYIRANCEPAAPGSASTGSSGSSVSRAELDSEDADTLLSIAFDGDTAIRERNTCISAYNSIRAVLNAE